VHLGYEDEKLDILIHEEIICDVIWPIAEIGVRRDTLREWLIIRLFNRAVSTSKEKVSYDFG
jgi:hypothetical protein